MLFFTISILNILVNFINHSQTTVLSIALHSFIMCLQSTQAHILHFRGTV